MTRLQRCTLLLLAAGFRLGAADWASSWYRYRWQGKPRLEFLATDSGYEFRILQLADLHLGENAWTDWGPEQDRRTWQALDAIIETERPNLLILSGDQLTANNINRNASAYQELLAYKLEQHGIPWAIIFGNHDDADLETEQPDGSTTVTPAKTSRQQLLRVDRSHRLSLSQLGDDGLPGVSNYWLEIFHGNEPAARVVLLDSGGGSMKQSITEQQIEWFFEHESDYSVPIVAFQHIPSADFAYDGDLCSGMANESVAALHADAGIVGALQASDKVLFLATGHNHGNDYCCPASSIHLCYGRHSGYGGYGAWDRGGRVYQLLMNASGNLTWRSYVRMESGEIIHEYEPMAVE